MRKTNVSRVSIACLVVLLGLTSCAADTGGVADRLSMTSDDPVPPVAVDGGSAQEEAIDMGVEPEDALEIIQFRAQLEAAIGDLEQHFGDRLLFGTYLEQMPEYVIYVTNIIQADSAWLQMVSGVGLGGTLAIEARPDLDPPSGPCLDRTNQSWGDTQVTASVGDQVVEASLGSISLRGCPDDPQGRSSHGDGFFLTLDEAELAVGSATAISVEVTGLREPVLETTLDVARDYAGERGGHVFELVAPDQPGTYEVDIETFWAEGSGFYRIRLIVAEL